MNSLEMYGREIKGTGKGKKSWNVVEERKKRKEKGIQGERMVDG